MNRLKITLVAAVALASTVNVFNANKSETLSDIVLANVEALAEDEGTLDKDCHYANGVTNIQLDEGFWHDTKYRYYDCCGVQVDGYDYEENCK